MAFKLGKVSPLDLKISLREKPISSIVYTVMLADETEPDYS